MKSIFWKRRFRQLTNIFTDKVYRKVLRKRLLLAGLNRVLPKASFLGLSDSKLTLLYRTRDRAISLYALALGNFHRSEIADIIALAEKNGATPGKILIEVGANIGTTTVSALDLKKFSYVYSFEPVGENIKVLKANLALNGFDQQVKVEQMALSDHEGQEEMIISSQNFGDNRIKRGSVGVGQGLFNEDTWEKIPIQSTTLDTYCRENNIASDAISLIWIDSQGFEGFILKGAAGLLAQRAFPILIEFWPKALKEAGCLELLCEMVEKHFSAFIDTRSNLRKAAHEISVYTIGFKEEAHTDLLLIP